MNFAAELKRAEDLAADVKAGRDPMAGVKGDVHLAYRSDLDGMLLPYRIYVPSSYVKTKKYPLIMFLHGAMVDENTMMNEGVLQRAAEDRGYIVAGVNGRGPMSGYSKESGAVKDVLDVMALMQKYYNIDASRIFLTGHSMGGGGTWSIGMAHRDLFAAIAVMAGTRSGTQDVDLDAAIASGPKIPILITCGGKDTNMPCPPAIAANDKLKAAGYTTKIVEYPDANHQGVFSGSIPEVFAWFDTHGK
jgi:dipeptidyl aminopeptidase/acylaminoacyl peptidase